MSRRTACQIRPPFFLEIGVPMVTRCVGRCRASVLDSGRCFVAGDTAYTSWMCSGCQGILESSGVFRVNPKPHRNAVREVHGLLRCQSETCKSHVQNVNPMLAGVACRYWNRDVNSARNIRIIATHTVRHGERPAPYRRG